MVACAQGAIGKMAVKQGSSPYNWASGATLMAFRGESLGKRGKIINPEVVTGYRGEDKERNRFGPCSHGGEVVLPVSPGDLAVLLPGMLGGSPSGASFPLAESLPSYGFLLDKVTSIDGGSFELQNALFDQWMIEAEQHGPDESDEPNFVWLTLKLVGKNSQGGVVFPSLSFSSSAEFTEYIFEDSTINALGADRKPKKWTIVGDNGVRSRYVNRAPVCSTSSTPRSCAASWRRLPWNQRRHEGRVIPLAPPTGKRVAIIGAGPAGRGCADQLVQRGHEVTIFESRPTAGGLLVYGIPNFKLSKEVWAEKWEEFERAGVKFVPNTYIGKDRTIDDLFNEGFDAVFIGVGSEIDAKMEDTPGTDLPGVYEATDFLIRGNVDPALLPEQMREPLVIGKKVAVVGGGDTASDCLRTALRLGADEVTCVYRRTEREMPGGKKDRMMAREEGAVYRFLTQPIKFITIWTCGGR